MKRSLPLLISMVLAISLSACGESSKLYPASKSEGVFFSVPNTWDEISSASLNKYERESAGTEGESRQALVKWQIAYSTNSKLKVSEVFDLTAPKAPLAFARVRDLEGNEIN